MKTSKFIVAALLAILALAGAGCELATNPLLFDGAPLVATFDVEPSPPSIFFGKDTTINLQTALENVESSIDSIRIFNVTIQIEPLDDHGAVTLVAAGVLVDGDTLVTATNVPVSAFATERSIFDKSLAGFAYNSTGVNHLIDLVKQNPLPTAVQVRAGGETNISTYHVRIKFRVYTQVFTNPHG